MIRFHVGCERRVPMWVCFYLINWFMLCYISSFRNKLFSISCCQKKEIFRLVCWFKWNGLAFQSALFVILSKVFLIYCLHLHSHFLLLELDYLLLFCTHQTIAMGVMLGYGIRIFGEIRDVSRNSFIHYDNKINWFLMITNFNIKIKIRIKIDWAVNNIKWSVNFILCEQFRGIFFNLIKDSGKFLFCMASHVLLYFVISYIFVLEAFSLANLDHLVYWNS